ncbi:MAG: hypothetical protein GXP05_01775 [Alphaproteobacteria bacterium]|nr:hypothetical protein [Alphaproteobacteria bacterium]
MKQSHIMSLIEAITNVVVWYGVAVIAQILEFPVFGLHTSLVQNLKMGLVFPGVSVTRPFVLRRLFEEVRAGRKKGQPKLAQEVKSKS